jgi:hypothetical protein
MSEDEFNDWLGCLNETETWLRAAFELMDGIEGYTAAGESSHVAALSSIRALRATEAASR